MKQKSGPRKAPAEQVVKDIRRQTRGRYSAEEKVRIGLEGLRGEENIPELCWREGITASMYYGWSKEFIEGGARRLAERLDVVPAKFSMIVTRRPKYAFRNADGVIRRRRRPISLKEAFRRKRAFRLRTDRTLLFN